MNIIPQENTNGKSGKIPARGDEASADDATFITPIARAIRFRTAKVMSKHQMAPSFIGLPREPNSSRQLARMVGGFEEGIVMLSCCGEACAHCTYPM